MNNVPPITETPKADGPSETELPPIFPHDLANNHAPRLATAQENKAPKLVASDEIGDLERSMSALRFVPTSVVLRNSKKS